VSITYNTRIVTTTPYTITLNDEVIFVNVAGPASIRLPTLSNSDCRAYYIKDYSGLSKTNPITITAPSGKTIDGVSFAMLNGGYSHLQLIYDGTNWMTIS
jgi:hypothetical protein